MRNDKTKLFFLNEKDAIFNDYFPQVFLEEKDANNERVENKYSYTREIIEDLLKFPVAGEIYQYLYKLPGKELNNVMTK